MRVPGRMTTPPPSVSQGFGNITPLEKLGTRYPCKYLNKMTGFHGILFESGGRRGGVGEGEEVGDKR